MIPGLPTSQTAVVTFVTVAGATAFVDYALINGFFTSTRIRGPDLSLNEAAHYAKQGETRVRIVHVSDEHSVLRPDAPVAKGVQLLKRHLAGTRVWLWGQGDVDGALVEASLLKWFHLNDNWFCNIEREVSAHGATRALRVWAHVDDVVKKLARLNFQKDASRGRGGTVSWITSGQYVGY